MEEKIEKYKKLVTPEIAAACMDAIVAGTVKGEAMRLRIWPDTEMKATFEKAKTLFGNDNVSFDVLTRNAAASVIFEAVGIAKFVIIPFDDSSSPSWVYRVREEVDLIFNVASMDDFSKKPLLIFAGVYMGEGRVPDAPISAIGCHNVVHIPMISYKALLEKKGGSIRFKTTV